MCCGYAFAGKSREVETFVTKPLISPSEGQARLEYSYGKKKWEVETIVTKPLRRPGAGQAYSECG